MLHFFPRKQDGEKAKELKHIEIHHLQTFTAIYQQFKVITLQESFLK